jgi:D-amino peptidase
MKVYIETDMEGVSGIRSRAIWNQPGPDYERARGLLTQDVNAAVQGALEAGATEVVVNDGHDGGHNLIAEELHEQAIVENSRSNKNVFPSLDDTFDALFAIGYHAMAGTLNAFLDHTQSSSWYNYYINGRKMGELGQTAAIAGHFKVPVVLVTGDEAVAQETHALLGEVETVAVKRGFGRFHARCLHPKRAQFMIREGAKRGAKRCKGIKPYVVASPIEIKLELATTDLADALADHDGVKRVDARTVVKVVSSALHVIDF